MCWVLLTCWGDTLCASGNHDSLVSKTVYKEEQRPLAVDEIIQYCPIKLFKQLFLLLFCDCARITSSTAQHLAQTEMNQQTLIFLILIPFYRSVTTKTWYLWKYKTIKNTETMWFYRSIWMHVLYEVTYHFYVLC